MLSNVLSICVIFTNTNKKKTYTHLPTQILFFSCPKLQHNMPDNHFWWYAIFCSRVPLGVVIILTWGAVRKGIATFWWARQLLLFAAYCWAKLCFSTSISLSHPTFHNRQAKAIGEAGWRQSLTWMFRVQYLSVACQPSSTFHSMQCPRNHLLHNFRIGNSFWQHFQIDELIA